MTNVREENKHKIMFTNQNMLITFLSIGVMGYAAIAILNGDIIKAQPKWNNFVKKQQVLK